MNVQNLFRSGVLVEIHISMWTGQKALTPEDLGLDPTKVSDAFILGRKYLIPETAIAEFRTLDGQARHVLDTSGFSFPIGGARFIPKKKLNEVIEELQEYKVKYDALSDKLVQDYAQHRVEMLPVYREAASQAYFNTTPTTEEFSIEGKEEAKKAFIEAFLARVETFYPSVEALRSKFSLEWNVFEISAPSKTEVANESWQKTVNAKMDAFVTDVVKTLRNEVVEACGKLHKRLVEGKVIHGNSLNALKDFIARYREMNFVGDTSIESQLNALEKEVLDVFPAERFHTDEDVQTELKRRLIQITEAVTQVSDINTVTGEYKRRVQWDD